MNTTFENVQTVNAIRPQSAVAGAVNGAAIDTQGFGDAMVVIDVGAVSGTPSSFSIAAKIQESADGSTGWTDITGSSITAVTAINKSSEVSVSLGARPASLRYIRAVVTPAFVSGSTPAALISAIAILGNPTYGPTTNSATTAN